MNRLISIALVCLLQVSVAVASAFKLSVEVTPIGSGSLNTSGGTYEEGSSVYLRTYGNTGYVFKGWYNDDTLLSSSVSFNYTMPSKDVTVQARYEYDPAAPGNPSMPDTTTYYSLTTQVSPIGAGSLNTTSGRYAAGATVNLRAYTNTGYQFVGWQNETGETLSTSTSYNYIMPHHDSQLRALYNYDPNVPANPDSMGTRYTVTVACRPVGGGTFNTTSATEEEGGNVHLYAYTNTGYRFLHWENEQGETISTAQNFYYVIPHGNSKVFGVFEYDPALPSNPNKNYWNKGLGEVIIDDFTPGSLGVAVSDAISGSSRNDVGMITVVGRMNDNDFGIANDYTNCTLLDLSRVTGISLVPSYAFDYTNLESVYLPATIEKIGYRAFYECKQLSSLIVYAMMPPMLENDVFTNVPEGLVVYVPAAAISHYQEAAVWKDFTLLPIQEDIRSITVSLPEGCSASDYVRMWLELTNTKSGQRMHYVMTDRTQYTFGNIIYNTSWNIALRNEQGDIFGQIDNVEVKDEDVNVTFAALSKPQNVMLSVQTPDNRDVTEHVQITWTDKTGNYLAQGASLSGLPIGYEASYRMVLSQELAMNYITPQAADYIIKDGGNNTVCQLDTIPQVQITGKVKDVTTGLALSGATVSASQTFGGKYSKTLNAKTDRNGEFTMSIFALPTSIAFAASDYISQTREYSDFELNELEDVLLKPISGVILSLSFTYTNCEGETQEWYSDYNNVSYTLYNVTKRKDITQFSVQYPQIVLLEDVEDGDVLRLTATSRTGSFMPVEVATTIAEQNASVTFDIVELGKIQASFSSNGNASVVGSLYDGAGKLVKTYNYSNAALIISDLADGSYTLVTMGSSRLFNTIYDLTQLPQTGLVEGTDYVQNTIEVESGIVSTIAINEVPTLDESKLYYTGDNTSFTVNKSSIVVGNYLTLTGNIDFKPAYSTSVSNVQMIVDLPESCEFVENSVMVGNSISSYTLNGSRIIIPMASYTDRVRFCIIPTLGGEYAPSAFVQFDLNGETVTQPIGSTNYTAKDLSISVPSTVAKTTIPVSGTAIGISNIEIYDNDVHIGSTTSLANGRWGMECELNQPYNLSKHSIVAKMLTQDGLTLKTETVECEYDRNAVEVKTVTMINTAHPVSSLNTCEFVTVFDFQHQTTSPSSYNYWPSYPDFTFVVDFTNNDTTVVSNVMVNVFLSHGQIQTLKASYNSRMGQWIATGRFETNNLPVNVSVSFNTVHKAVLDAEELKVILTGFDNLQEEVTSSEQRIDSILTLIDDDGLTTLQLLSELAEAIGNSTPILGIGEQVDSCELVKLLQDIDVLLAQNEAQIFDHITEIDIRNIPDELAELMSGIRVSTAQKIDSLSLVADGYESYPLSDGTSLFVKATDSIYSFVAPCLDIMMMIDINTCDEELVSGLMMARDSSDFDERMKKYCASLRKWANKVQEVLSDLSSVADTIYDVIHNLILDADLKYDVLARSLVNLQLTGEIERPLTGWEKIQIAITKAKLGVLSKTINKLRKASEWLNQLKMGRVIGGGFSLWSLIQTYQGMLDGMENLIELYYRIPDCPGTQSGNPLRSKVKSFGYGAAVYYLALITSDAAAIATAIAGTSSAPLTLGSSLALVVVGLAKIGATYYANMVYDEKYKHLIDEINEGIANMKCDSLQLLPPPPPLLPDVTPIHDPSGFVYEGVSNNRIEGVTATAFYKETVEDIYGDLHENIVKWNAEEYAQENPLFTDEYGMYAWDVPQGLWQVKFEKEGYETTYSEWLPVPPPQLDVNIAMKQNVQPNVKAARAYEDAVEVEFDKYMMPELLNTENIMVMQNGTAVEGAIELLNEEVTYEGETETFASKIRFNAAQPFTEQEITLMVNNRVKSYAGIRMQDNYEQTFAIEQEIKRIVCDSLLAVGYGKNGTMTVSVLPASASKGKMLTVKSSSPAILRVETEQVTIDKNGKAEITICGELPGTAALTFTVEGTDKEGLTIVSVEANKTVATPTASIASGSVVEKGTQVTLSCATSGATIFYTLDGSCPCDETSTRKVYDGSPIIINESMVIKTMATAPDMYESDVAEFVYFVNDGSGITNVTIKEQIHIYPQPVHDKLNITAGSKTIKSVKVSALNGVIVASSSKESKTISLDVSTITAGIYIVTIQTMDGIYSCKVLKVE